MFLFLGVIYNRVSENSANVDILAGFLYHGNGNPDSFTQHQNNQQKNNQQNRQENTCELIKHSTHILSNSLML